MEVDVCAVAMGVGVSCCGVRVRRGNRNSPFHANQLEIPAKIPRIQPGDRKTVSEPRHGRLEVALVEIRVQARRLVHRRIHVRPNEGNRRPRDAPSLIRDLDRDVLLALCDDDLGDREILLVLTSRLHHGAQRVLESLEQHVRQVTWDVHEADVGVADELDLGRLEQAVVVLADEARVLYGFLGEFVDVGLGADYADVVGVGALALVGEGNVLADEHADADTRHVEAVEEGLDIVIDLHALLLALPLQDALCHGRHHAVVPPLDFLQGLCELCVVGAQLHGPFLAIVGSGIVSARCGGALDLPRVTVAVAIRTLGQRPVLALLDARVLCAFGSQRIGFLSRLEKAVLHFGGDVRPGQVGELLWWMMSQEGSDGTAWDVLRTTVHTNPARGR